MLPSERVLWRGSRRAHVAYDRRYWILPALAFPIAVVWAFFAALLHIEAMDGVRHAVALASFFAALGVGGILLPRHLLDGCEYVVTDRRVIWRRRRIVRSMDRRGVTFARIRWHRTVAGVGDLELVRATPFGPLARRQRLVLHDVQDPDRVLAVVRGGSPTRHSGDLDLPLAERLEPGEIVRWGGHPEGLLLGWREMATASIGVAVTFLAMHYGYQAARILLGLEDLGLQVKSWEWSLLFLAVTITWSLLVGVGGGLVWYGFWRARALGRATEYVLTDRRLLIRRGLIELSVDRGRIVDVADKAGPRGLHHLFLVLDAPESRALADSGAMAALLPSRDSVPPVLYELRDVDGLRELILGRESRSSIPS